MTAKFVHTAGELGADPQVLTEYGAMAVVTTDRTPGVLVRWAVRRDMDEIVEIERLCFEFPWSKEDFIRCLRQRNCIAMVALVGDCVVGQMTYELHRTRLHLLNFAVLPSMQRKGIGRVMMLKLLNKLSVQRRNLIVLEVRESNLDAQLFFQAMGFKAVSVLRDFYDDTTEDAYLFQYRFAS